MRVIGVTGVQTCALPIFDLVHDAPEVAERVVTVSPDVASSTNLGGWINKAEIWSVGERRDWFADDPQTLVHWHETPARSEEHTSELQSRQYLVCRLLLEKK